MLKIVDIPQISILRSFQEFVFGLAGAGSHAEFSSTLCSAHSKGENLAAKLQDEILASQEFRALIEDTIWKEISAEAFGCAPEDVSIILPNLRIDLPDRFREDSTRMLLPWHQEAEYFLSEGNCSPASIVLSTCLHDAAAQNGALVVAAETETSLLKHGSEYKDPENKRFLRLTVGEPGKFLPAETTFGQTVVFDFMRRHRSGNNTSDLVRITFLLRASRKSDVEEYLSGNMVATKQAVM